MRSKKKKKHNCTISWVLSIHYLLVIIFDFSLLSRPNSSHNPLCIPCPFYDPEICVEIFVELYASTVSLLSLIHCFTHFKKQCCPFRKLLTWISLSTAQCSFSYIQLCSHKCKTQMKIGSFHYWSTPASPTGCAYNEYSCAAQHLFQTFIYSVDYASTALHFSSTIVFSIYYKLLRLYVL